MQYCQRNSPICWDLKESLDQDGKVALNVFKLYSSHPSIGLRKFPFNLVDEIWYLQGAFRSIGSDLGAACWEGSGTALTNGYCLTPCLTSCWVELLGELLCLTGSSLLNKLQTRPSPARDRPPADLLKGPR